MRARLDRMNDGLQTTQELETMIYQSAQRSRGSFTDTMGLVSQLGTMAGDAFSSSKEIVQFAEQLNKQLPFPARPVRLRRPRSFSWNRALHPAFCAATS